MQGSEMKVIRERLGMTELQLARAIGYTGTDRNDDTRIREYERGKKQIPLYIARLVWLIDEVEGMAVGSPASVILRQDGRTGDLRGFPDWPGYDFEHTPDEVVIDHACIDLSDKRPR